MSTFPGTISDLPHFSIDRFDGENLVSTAFFLSHCHSDHMKGLFDNEFIALLEENKNYFLYMSPVSAAILRNLCPALKNHIQELDPYSSTTISDIAVSTIPAGHCPGSVMFLFESEKKTILYTGDFRVNLQHVTKIKALQNENSLKTIDDIYVDTTFFFEEYKWFPSREESLRKICSIIEKWFSRSPSNTIQLHTSAKYGYEYLFIEISRQFKMPVFIPDRQVFDFYSVIPEMDSAVTSDAASTRISAGIYNRVSKDQHSIRISAWKWKNASYDEDVNDGSSVCYSTHPSYDESVEFLKILKPKRIEPNVVRNETKEILYRNIQQCLDSFNENESESRTRSVESLPVKLFKISEKENTASPSQVEEYDSELFDSPPRRRKKVFV